jgi:hypothetical protein
LSSRSSSGSFSSPAPGGLALRALGLQILQDALDAVLALDVLVEEELKFGNASQAQPLADLPAQERLGPLERAAGLRPRLGIAERRVIDARVLQVRRDLDARDGDEAYSRIVDRARQKLRDVLTNCSPTRLGRCWGIATMLNASAEC